MLNDCYFQNRLNMKSKQNLIVFERNFILFNEYISIKSKINELSLNFISITNNSFWFKSNKLIFKIN